MHLDNVFALCPREAVSLEPILTEPTGSDRAFALAEDAVEEMVVCLAAIEASWAAGEFSRSPALLSGLIDQAKRAGLPDVIRVAEDAQALMEHCDEVALAAVIARLIRVGETSLATLLEISYRQI